MFVIYAREDKETKLSLLRHLNPLKEGFKLSIWHDDEIEPGQLWKPHIESRLNHTDIFLLLVSVDFLNSQFIKQVEFKAAVDRHKDKKSIVIPIIIDYCQWDIDFTLVDDTFNLNELQALPDEAKPIGEWRTPDQAYNNIAAGVRRVLKSIRTGIEEQELKAGQEKKEAEKKEELSWKMACDRNTIQEYDNYLSEYAPGKFANEAIAAIKILYAKAEAEEVKRKAEEEKRLKEEAEAKRRAEEEKRLREEAEAKRKAEEEEIKRQEAAETKRKAEEKKRLQEENEAKRLAAVEKRRKEEAEAKRKAEEEEQNRREVAEAKKRAEQEKRLKEEAEAKRLAAAAEKRLKKEAKAKRKAEEEKKQQEEEKRRKEVAEADRKAEEEEKRRKEEEERRAEEARIVEEAERSKKRKTRNNILIGVGIIIAMGLAGVMLIPNMVSPPHKPKLPIGSQTNEDSIAWNTIRPGDKSALESYLKKFPNGDYVNQAHAMIASLKKTEELTKLKIGDTFKEGMIVTINHSSRSGLIASAKDAGPMHWKAAMKIDSKLGEGWRLPSMEELKLMYRNIGPGSNTNNIGDFSSGLYWSSTSYNNNQARLLRFRDANTTYHFSKDFEDRRYLVRAIRDFTY